MAPRFSQIFYDEAALERAVEHAEDFWFPVNERLLDKIQSGLQENTYDTDSLVKELQSDFSLFTFCLRELKKLVSALPESSVASQSPLDKLREAGIENLTKILALPRSEISRHNLDRATQLQTARLGEAMTSAAAAETLAPSMEIDAGVGFSAALIRQLGYTLIAWNYPSVYRKAIASAKSQSECDLAIARRLGFTPSLLAIRIVERWSLFTDCELIFDSDFEEEELALKRENSVSLRSLSRLCQIAEALARANYPEQYPTAEQDWHTASTEISKALGDGGIRIIQMRIELRAKAYTDAIPDAFEREFSFRIPTIPKKTTAEELAAKNPYLPLCSENVQAQLIELYQNIQPNSVLIENISLLLKRIIPLAEFSAGCVFTVDPTVAALIPQMRIGVVRLREFTPISYTADHLDDSVVRAFETLEPICEQAVASNGISLVSFASAIGYTRSIGVLYLEMLKVVHKESPEQHLNNFLGFSYALAACLNVGDED